MRALIEARATVELQRFMSVKAQTHALGKLLVERGWPGVVLKGAAHAAEGGEPIDTADVDILLPREHATAYAALMEARGGYRAIGGVDAAGAEGAGWQLAMRVAEHGVQVEVHYDVPHVSGDMWEGLVPTPIPGVLRLSPANHLWHVLVHGTVHHRERAGTVRELLLLRGARAACSAVELGEVERRAAAHPRGRVMLAVLAMVEALDRGETPEDPFRESSALRYALAAGAGPRAGRLRMGTVSAAYALLEGDGAYRTLWVGSVDSALSTPSFRGTTRLDRFAIPAWLVRTGVRSAGLLSGTPGGWRLARAARRAAAL